MNTPAHVMLNLGGLGRYKPPRHQLFVVVGAMISDVPLFLFYFWEKVLRRVPESDIWQHYFDNRWQAIFDLLHSFPVIILGGVVSYFAKWKGFVLFWMSMALHSVGDLPVHHDDGHRHFSHFPTGDLKVLFPTGTLDFMGTYSHCLK